MNNSSYYLYIAVLLLGFYLVYQYFRVKKEIEKKPVEFEEVDEFDTSLLKEAERTNTEKGVEPAETEQKWFEKEIERAYPEENKAESAPVEEQHLKTIPEIAEEEFDEDKAAEKIIQSVDLSLATPTAIVAPASLDTHIVSSDTTKYSFDPTGELSGGTTKPVVDISETVTEVTNAPKKPKFPPGHNVGISAALRKNIAHEFKTGTTVSELADTHNVSRSTITRIVEYQKYFG